MMHTDALFHAYIVGGTKEASRSRIREMLETAGMWNNPKHEVLFAEYVNFGIDDARALKEWQELAPTGDSKTYVVLSDFVTKEAQNALLKTFEEPVRGTHLFLAVPNPEAMLETLRSRSRIVLDTTPTTSIGDTTLAKDFLKAPLVSRLATIADLTEKSDDDDASARVRSGALRFLESLEVELSKDVRAHESTLAYILEMKKYLQLSGASVRMILESIALTV